MLKFFITYKILNSTLLFLNPRILFFIWGSLISLLPGTESIQLKNIVITKPVHTAPGNFISSSVKNGYTAVINYKNGFVATGSDGRIDRISLSGEITSIEKFPNVKFNSLISNDQMIMAAGDNGKVVIASDGGTFRKIDSGTDENINSLTLFDGIVIAGTDGGELLYGDSKGFFQMIQLDLKGKIVSVSSNKTDCFGVTDEGEVIHSKDGKKWDVFDFNKVYDGFYKPCNFRKILVTENRIAVIGTHKDGSPAVLFSSQGNVWTERSLNYTDDQGTDGYLEVAPNDIIYIDFEDQYYITCDSGMLLILPNCNHCNTLTGITNIKS